MPLSNGNPTAAELDRALVGERAYDAAVAGGETHDQAVKLAREAMREHHQAQILERVGVRL